MTTRLYESETVGRRPAEHTPRRASAQLSGPMARSILSAALLLGIGGDALMHDGPTGIAFGLWIALVALNAVSLLWRSGRSVSRETAAWLTAACLFSLGLAWRNSDPLAFFDFCATIGCLAMAAIASSDPERAIFARRMRDTVVAAVRVAGGVAIGILPLAFRELFAESDAKRVSGRLLPITRAVIISGALLLVFGALLRGADPIFASLVALPALDFGNIVSHVVLTCFFAWIVGGWVRTLLIDRSTADRVGMELPFRLDTLDVTTALGTLNILFAAFVLTQLGWFFGGERFLRERTGLTAAAYARQGFFQLVWVVTLVVPVLVGTRAALRPGRALARRHTLLSLPIIALLGAIIVSAALRMKLYVHFYGLTTERFYPLVFMAWLAIVLAWLAVTVLRDWGQPFVAGAAISGLATLAVLNVVDPDAYVARVNIARAARPPVGTQPSLDLAYLSRLSGGAVDLAVTATVATAALPTSTGGGAQQPLVDAQRCVAAQHLLQRWGPVSRASERYRRDAAWRNWNADDAAALRSVARHANALIQVKHAACAAVPRPADQR